jgi:2'-5' RNA ligase
MRLFTGFDLSADVIRRLDGLLDQLRPTANIKWSPPANLHVTIRFIGEWPDARLPDLRSALAALPSHPAVSIHVRQLGFFPNPYSPRIFWAGVEASPELVAVATGTDRAIQSLGLPPETRPYRPHLTLARIKEPVAIQKLRESIAALPSDDFGTFAAGSFFLYQSLTGASGSVYTKLAEFPLSK